MRLRRPAQTIKFRLVRNVAIAMTLVLLATSGFVFWRVQHALDRQVDRDLKSYHDVVAQAVGTETEVPSQTPGQYYQVFSADGTVAFGSSKTPIPRLLSAASVERAGRGKTVHVDRGYFFPASSVAFRLEATAVDSPSGRVVVAAAISRQPRDEALRELLGQLLLADLLVLLAASYVGYRTARGALDPVERYRRAAKQAGERPGDRLPVADDRDDELTRLGHTFNGLLSRIEAETEREHRYIADASHELRTPLSLLKAEVELALHNPRDAEYLRGVLVAVSAEVDRLADLSNSLLDLEELESGVAASEADIDIAGLLAAIAARHRPVLEREGRTITSTADAGLFRLSEPWLVAALNNLISNAIRYGAGEVSLSAGATDGSLIFAVEDAGEGFPAEMRDQAFDRFVRADQARTTRGSGLGLALVKAVAEAHGGTAYIALSGSPTRVAIELPLSPR